MLLSDLHKIGPSDTPISSSPPPLLPCPDRASLPGWRAPAGYCMQAPRHSLTEALRYSGTSFRAQPGPNLAPRTKLEQLTHQSLSLARRSPGLGTTMPDLFVDGNLA